MAGFNPINSLKEAGGVFKFGKGVLGKSAIPLGVLMVLAVVAAWRLQSDIAIIFVLVLAAVIFFLWFFPVLRFSEKHPDIALLDGAEWSGWKRFEAAAKGFRPPPEEQQALPEPGTLLLPPKVDAEESDE